MVFYFRFSIVPHTMALQEDVSVQEVELGVRSYFEIFSVIVSGPRPIP